MAAFDYHAEFHLSGAEYRQEHCSRKGKAFEGTVECFVGVGRAILMLQCAYMKESMKMMGLPNWLHWTAWFVKSLAFIFVTILLITLLLKVIDLSG